MAEKATCPVCKSHSSAVLADIENGKDCRKCGCSNEHLILWQEVLEKSEIYHRNKIHEEIYEENMQLKKQVIFLKTKFEKLKDILGDTFQSEIKDKIDEVLWILTDTVEKSRLENESIWSGK